VVLGCNARPEARFWVSGLHSARLGPHHWSVLLRDVAANDVRQSSRRFGSHAGVTQHRPRDVRVGMKKGVRTCEKKYIPDSHFFLSFFERSVHHIQVI
jgi:hypothetical protein